MRFNVHENIMNSSPWKEDCYHQNDYESLLYVFTTEQYVLLLFRFIFALSIWKNCSSQVGKAILRNGVCVEK